MKDLHQYVLICQDSDNNPFKTYTKAESKTHATAIIESRIACKKLTNNKSALGDGNTRFKCILKGARQVAWTAITPD